MTRTLTPALVALLVVAAFVPAPALALGTPPASTPEVVEYGTAGHPSFIVEFSEGSADSVRTWANSSGARTLIRLDNASNTALVAGPSHEIATPGLFERLASLSVDVLLARNALSERGFVESVHPNYRLQRTEPVDSLINQSGFSVPDAPLQMMVSELDPNPSFDPTGIAFSGDANTTTMAESRSILGVDNVSATGQGVTVAVIDTGANTANGKVFGNGTAGSSLRILNASKNFLTNETVGRNGTDAIADGAGHGTWVSAAAAANHSNDTHDGVAPDASLLVLKALSDDGSGSTADIRRAVRYAADQGADVISMSLGSPVYSQPLADAIEYATEQGSVVVVAAGNSRQTTRWVASPGDADGALAVAATNGKAATSAESAYFSQVGPDPGTLDASGGETAGEAIDVAAPGMETLAKTPSESGILRNSTLSGTSMATPMVAGGIALALDANPSWSVATVTQWVRDGARPMPNAATSEVGHGMFAADNTITQTAPSQEQTAAQTPTATTRDEFYSGLSNAQGGVITQLLLEVRSLGGAVS